MKRRFLRSKKGLRPLDFLGGRDRSLPGRVVVSFRGDAAHRLLKRIAAGEVLADGVSLNAEFFGAHVVDGGLPEDGSGSGL